MSQLQEVTKENFEDVIRGATQTVLVDFWAPWCGPCRMITPELEAAAAELGEDVKVVKVNVDSEPELAEAFGIQSIPNLILFRNGEPVRQMIGFVGRNELVKAVRAS